MSEGGWVRRIQPFVIGTRLSALPDPQDQGEPSWSPCPTGHAASDRTCSPGLEEEDEEEEEDSLSPAYSSSRSIRKIAICRGGQPGPPDPSEADPGPPDTGALDPRETSPGPPDPRETSPGPPDPRDPSPPDPGPLNSRDTSPTDPGSLDPRETRPLDPGPFDPRVTGTPYPKDTRPPNPGPLDPREKAPGLPDPRDTRPPDPGSFDPREPGRGGPRGRQASWEDHPGGARRALVSAGVEEQLGPPEESRPLVAGSDVEEEEEPQRESTSDHLLSSLLGNYKLDVKLALDVSSFYQTADGLLATMDSKHLAELTNKEELEELTLKIAMLDHRVVCLSAVHPTLASRLTQKQTEVRDRWHRLLEWRSVEGASCLKPGHGEDQSGLDVEFPAFTVKTLRWLEDSASLATAGRQGGVRTKRPFRKRRSLRRRIYQLLSRCAELCMDILEAQDLMVLRCEPQSPMMDTFTQQQHTLELEQEVMRPDVEELEHVTSDPQCEDMGACLQAWEEVTRGLAENNLCLQHVENIQRFLRDYLDIISWAEETRTALLSKGSPLSSIGLDHPGPHLEQPLDPPLHHLPEPPLHHPPAPVDHQDPVDHLEALHHQDPVHHRVQQKLKDLSVLEAEGRLLFPESSHLAPTIKERMEELQGMLGWIQLNGRDRRNPGYHSNQLEGWDMGRQDDRSPSSEALLPPTCGSHEKLQTQSPAQPSPDPIQVPQCLVTMLTAGGDGISLVLTFDPESPDKGHEPKTAEPSHRVSRFLQVSDLSRGGPLPLDGLPNISSSTTSSSSSTTTTTTFIPSSTTPSSTTTFSSSTTTTSAPSSTTPSSTTTSSSSTTTTSVPSSTTTSSTTFLPKVSTVVLPATPALTSVSSLKVHTKGRRRRTAPRRPPSGPPQAEPQDPSLTPHRANTWPLDQQTSDCPPATTRPRNPGLQLYMKQNSGVRTRGVKGPDQVEVRGHGEGRYTVPLGSTFRLDLPRSLDELAKLTSEGHSLARTSPLLVRSSCLKTCLSGSHKAPGPGTPQPTSRDPRLEGEMSEEHVRAPSISPLCCHLVDTPHSSRSTEEPRSPPPHAEGVSTPRWDPGMSVAPDQASCPSSRAVAPETLEPPEALELLRHCICPSVHTKISDLEGHLYYHPKHPAPLHLHPDQTGSVSPLACRFGRVVVCSAERQTCWFCSGPDQRGDPQPQTAGGLPPERRQFEEVEGELEDIWNSVTKERAP